MLCKICGNITSISQTESNKSLTQTVLIKSILDDRPINEPLTPALINKVLNSPRFTKLPINDQEKIKKQMAILYQQNTHRGTVHICKECNYTFEITPGEVLFTWYESAVNDKLTITADDMYHDKLLPYTKNYVCINDKCSSHTNENDRLFKFTRESPTSYNIIYLCMTCKTLISNR